MHVIEELSNYATVVANEPMRFHTSMRVGGHVKYFITPNSIDSLIEIIQILQKNHQKYLVLGRGSNIIFPDHDMDLAIISINHTIDHLEIDGSNVRVGAGYSFQKLSKKLSKIGLSGLEFGGGIPGTVGGAVFMNAGAHSGEIKDIITQVKTINQQGIIKEYNKEECQFSYRHSIFQENKEIIIEVKLFLPQHDKAEIFKRMSGNLEYRKELQPLELPSCGSVFKNPNHMHAGALIDEAGLKGFRIGGAEVSKKHANFIVNVDDATAADVLAVRDHVIKVIKEKYNIDLVSEMRVFEEVDEKPTIG